MHKPSLEPHQLFSGNENAYKNKKSHHILQPTIQKNCGLTELYKQIGVNETLSSVGDRTANNSDLLFFPLSRSQPTRTFICYVVEELIKMYEMFAQLKTRARSPMHVSSPYAFVHVQGGRDTKNARKCNALRVQCTFWPYCIHYVCVASMATRLNRLENRTHVGWHCGGLSQKEVRVLWVLKFNF